MFPNKIRVNFLKKLFTSCISVKYILLLQLTKWKIQHSYNTTLYLDMFQYEYDTYRDYSPYYYMYMMLRINLVVFNRIYLTINLLEPSHHNIICSEKWTG